MKTSVAFAAAVAALLAVPAQASMELAQKKSCMACHATDKKLVGPSYKDVAAKYAGQKDAVAQLAERVFPPAADRATDDGAGVVVAGDDHRDAGQVDQRQRRCSGGRGQRQHREAEDGEETASHHRRGTRKTSPGSVRAIIRASSLRSRT